MKLVAVGISHKILSIEHREKFYLNLMERELLLTALKNNPSVIEAFILSTCNRTEVYALALKGDEDLIELLCSIKKTPFNKSVKELFYQKSGEEAVKHFFEVATGLDSLILGEKQILGQVKDALELAKKHNMLGRYLNILSNLAIRAGKKARTETDINCGGDSISWAAVQTAQNMFGSLEGISVLVLGIGKMGSLTIQQLKTKNVKDIYLMSRNYEKAHEVAKQNGVSVASYWELKEVVKKVDLIFCSASAPHYLIPYDLIRESMAIRSSKPLLCVDISMPRNIDPKIATIEGVRLATLDDLNGCVDVVRFKRQSAVDAVKRIIDVKLAAFEEKLIKVDFYNKGLILNH